MSTAASGERRWAALALLGAAAAHAPVLAGGLLDADRLLLVRNPDVRSFAGLWALLAGGEPVVRASGLLVRSRAPLGVISTWLGWQWFRASPPMQHAVSVALIVAVAASLWSLLAPRHALAAAAAVGLVLHPSAADLTGPILGRDVLLAMWVTLLAARRAKDARTVEAIAWSSGASLVAGMLSPGWGPLGLVAALFIPAVRARRIAVAASITAAIAAIAISRADLSQGSVIGAGAALVAWIPSATPFVIATVGGREVAGLGVAAILVSAALLGALRATSESDAALLRAGAGAMVAALFASAIACHEDKVSGEAAVALQLGVVLALAGAAGSMQRFAARLRPWMLSLLVIPAALTAVRARAWADEDAVLHAVITRDPDDPEAFLAHAQEALARRKLDEALPFCVHYASAEPATFRADGCIAAAAAGSGDEGAAVALLRRWAVRFDDRHALRAAIVDLAEAQPDPRFAAAFQKATGFAMPAHRPGDSR